MRASPRPASVLGARGPPSDFLPSHLNRYDGHDTRPVVFICWRRARTSLRTNRLCSQQPAIQPKVYTPSDLSYSFRACLLCPSEQGGLRRDLILRRPGPAPLAHGVAQPFEDGALAVSVAELPAAILQLRALQSAENLALVDVGHAFDDLVVSTNSCKVASRRDEC